MSTVINFPIIPRAKVFLSDAPPTALDHLRQQMKLALYYETRLKDMRCELFAIKEACGLDHAQRALLTLAAELELK